MSEINENVVWFGALLTVAGGVAGGLYAHSHETQSPQKVVDAQAAVVDLVGSIEELAPPDSCVIAVIKTVDESSQQHPNLLTLQQHLYKICGVNNANLDTAKNASGLLGALSTAKIDVSTAEDHTKLTLGELLMGAVAGLGASAVAASVIVALTESK